MTVEETWELARRLYKSKGIEGGDFNKIFDGKNKKEVFEMSPYEVKRIIDKLDEEKKICIGDMVKYSNDVKGIILDKSFLSGYYVFNENGCIELLEESYLTKIKHTEFVEELLKNIR